MARAASGAEREKAKRERRIKAEEAEEEMRIEERAKAAGALWLQGVSGVARRERGGGQSRNTNFHLRSLSRSDTTLTA